MSAIDDLKAFAVELRGQATLPSRLGALAAPGVQAAAVAQVSAGRTPDGAAWPPTQDGGKPLRGAAGELSTVGTSNGLRVKLEGPSAWHDAGAGSAPRRQVLPDAGQVPDSYATAVDAAFRQAVP